MNPQEPDERVPAASARPPEQQGAPPSAALSPIFRSLMGPEKRTVRVILAGAAALIVISLVVVLVPGEPSAPGSSGGAAAGFGSAAAPWTPTSPAGELRRQAVQSCKSEQWEKCEAAFNEAARLDPKGDEIAVIQRWRTKIAEGLHRD